MHPRNLVLLIQAYRFSAAIYFWHGKWSVSLIKEFVMLHFIFVNTAHYNKSSTRMLVLNFLSFLPHYCWKDSISSEV